MDSRLAGRNPFLQDLTVLVDEFAKARAVLACSSLVELFRLSRSLSCERPVEAAEKTMMMKQVGK